MTNGNEPINPTTERNWLNQNDTEMVTGVFGGLTKREYFAAMAMQGILANHWCQDEFNGKITAIGDESVAAQSLLYADALITKLNKTD